jgi:hypothetical protein
MKHKKCNKIYIERKQQNLTNFNCIKKQPDGFWVDEYDNIKFLLRQEKKGEKSHGYI